MRPNTSESGIFSTKRRTPVSTSILPRILGPKPKKAFQSPGVHKAGLKPDVPAEVLVLILKPLLLSYRSLQFHRFKNCGGVADPAEDATLGLDHLEAHLVEFRKIGSAAVGEHDAAIATVVRLANGGVDADLGRHAADEQVFDAVFLQDIAEFGR